MANWTNIAKPTDSTYTRINPVGKEQYDQASLTYNDTNVFYDGVNLTAYTNLAKPIGGLVIQAGMATALSMPVAWSRSINARDRWTRVSKPV